MVLELFFFDTAMRFPAMIAEDPLSNSGFGKKHGLIWDRSSPGSRALNLPMIAAVPVGRRLNDGLQSALVVVLQVDEAEGLQAQGQRGQHFRGANHHPGGRKEHQLAIAPGVERMWHGQQAPGERNHFQFARDASPVCESKYRRRRLGKMHSCGPRGLRWGKRLHTCTKIP